MPKSLAISHRACLGNNPGEVLEQEGRLIFVMKRLEKLKEDLAAAPRGPQLDVENTDLSQEMDEALVMAALTVCTGIRPPLHPAPVTASKASTGAVLSMAQQGPGDLSLSLNLSMSLRGAGDLQPEAGPSDVGGEVRGSQQEMKDDEKDSDKRERKEAKKMKKEMKKLKKEVKKAKKEAKRAAKEPRSDPLEEHLSIKRPRLVAAEATDGAAAASEASPTAVPGAPGGEDDAGGCSGFDSGFDFDDDDAVGGNGADGMALWGMQAASKADAGECTNGAVDTADVDADDSGLDFDKDDNEGAPDSQMNAGMALWGARE